MWTTRYGPDVTARVRTGEPTHPGAASTVLRGLLTGPDREARVLGSHRTCVYLQVGSEVLVIESADALGLPCAVRLGIDSGSAALQGVRRTDPATVGRGVLAVGELNVRVARWWAPRRPRPGIDPQRLPALALSLAGHPAPVPIDAPVTDLVGLGPGLTPAGDDVLAGMLVALHHADARRRLAAQILPLAAQRTTALSTTLLNHAAEGYTLPALIDLADSVAGHAPAGALPDVVARLMEVGHSSGTAMAWGLLRGARVATALRAQAA